MCYPSNVIHNLLLVVFKENGLWLRGNPIHDWAGVWRGVWLHKTDFSGKGSMWLVAILEVQQPIAAMQEDHHSTQSLMVAEDAG